MSSKEQKLIDVFFLSLENVVNYKSPSQFLVVLNKENKLEYVRVIVVPESIDDDVIGIPSSKMRS